MKNNCDLHTHSYYSDGSDSPEQILIKAQALGLGAVALCDHNTAKGLPEFLEKAKGTNVQAVAGVEFSADYKDKEVHILALFVPETAFDGISEFVRLMAENKYNSNINLINSLKNAGYDVDYHQIASKTKGNINRAHVAAELMQKGYVSSVKEAFDTVLSPKQGHYVPPKRPDAFSTIAFINSIGAVSSLAHPLLNLNEEELDVFLDIAKKNGLDAMETAYSEFTPQMCSRAQQAALKHGLLQSGGSDYHGERKPHIKLATGTGNLCVPMEYFNKLKRRSEEKRQNIGG